MNIASVFPFLIGEQDTIKGSEWKIADTYVLYVY